MDKERPSPEHLDGRTGTSIHSWHRLQRINDVPFRFASPKYGIVHSNQTLKLRDELERLAGVYILYDLYFDLRGLIPR